MQIGGIALYSALFNKCLNTPSNHDINMYLHTTKTKINILLEAECEKNRFRKNIYIFRFKYYILTTLERLWLNLYSGQKTPNSKSPGGFMSAFQLFSLLTLLHVVVFMSISGLF